MIMRFIDSEDNSTEFPDSLIVSFSDVFLYFDKLTYLNRQDLISLFIYNVLDQLEIHYDEKFMIVKLYQRRQLCSSYFFDYFCLPLSLLFEIFTKFHHHNFFNSYLSFFKLFLSTTCESHNYITLESKSVRPFDSIFFCTIAVVIPYFLSLASALGRVACTHLVFPQLAFFLRVSI